MLKRVLAISAFLVAVTTIPQRTDAAIIEVSVTLSAVETQSHEITVAYEAKGEHTTATLKVSSNAEIIVNGRYVTLESVTPGLRARVSFDNTLRVITKIDAAEENSVSFNGGADGHTVEFSAMRDKRIHIERHRDGQPRVLLSISVPQVKARVQVYRPLAVEVVDTSRRSEWIEEDYSSAVSQEDCLICSGDLKTPHGTHFHVEDRYSCPAISHMVEMQRSIRIDTPSPHDIGFMSRFCVRNARQVELKDYEVFVPGIWYRDNRNVPPMALASDLSDSAFLFREDRLPLPMAMLRDKNSGLSLALIHKSPNGSTFLGDRGLERVVDERMQFGSLGVIAQHQAGLAFVFPGSEGEKTYIAGRSDQKRWALRSHPVKSDVCHEYTLLIDAQKTPTFPVALTTSWRDGYTALAPSVEAVSLEKVYSTGINVLGRYWKEFDGVPGFPFSVSLPSGVVKENSLQMGFVGQQIAAAHHLIRFGLENNDASLTLKGEGIIDFWASRSLTDAGLPRTWFDVYPNRWRNYNTYLRVACDGAVGVLNGWEAMRRHGRDKPEWREYCERFGDWLVANQNSDGSFYRNYDFAGHPVEKSTFNTTHPIRFLVDLAKATRSDKYLRSAVLAGDFCNRHVHSEYKYVGGTPDNPDVVDKEAGLIAIDAFLALYDTTQQEPWLNCAVQAATYSETWLYCWNVPMVPGDDKCDFPAGRSTCGLSLIATGHSGADAFMAYYPFQFYRLYLYTGDDHFRDVARVLLYNTKQTIDLNGSLGYAARGLQTEAMTITVPRGHSVRVWLPWLTVAAIDPLVQMKDTFGAFSIEEIERRPVQDLKKLNREYGRTRGFTEQEINSRVNEKSVFLDDLREIESAVGHGNVGKRGSHGYGDALIAVKGRKIAHALSLHPPQNGAAYISYLLDGGYREFTAEVAISDSAPKPSESPLTFRVMGDGKTLWTSNAIKNRGQPEKCRIKMSGVKELKLIVECPGGNAWAFGVWVEPLLTK